MKRFIPLPLIIAATVCCGAGPELVKNGSFEQLDPKTGTPDGWSVSGSRAIEQRLTSDAGREGGRCAKLECTRFEGDSPSSHVMLCQTGVVTVARGRWYRLSLWAKGQDIKSAAVEVGLSNMRGWKESGLGGAFVAPRDWKRFEFLFRAKDDVPAASSRLQFWFRGTGTLWMDDVSLVETPEGREWFPRIATDGPDGARNFIPNSSFECGAANWGSVTYGVPGWSDWVGNLYQLCGDTDTSTAAHGRTSLKIALRPDTLPQLAFDYIHTGRTLTCARRTPVRVLAANRGWFWVRPGEKLTLSASLRADRDGVAAQMVVQQAEGGMLHKAVTLGTQWQRHEFTFAPWRRCLYIAIGPDLEASKLDAATVWLDAVQLERGERATAYEPRQALESFIETGKTGNVFMRPAEGATITVRACNDTDSEQTVRGKLAVTDFFDRTVFESEPTIKVPARSSANTVLRGLCKDRHGYFRAAWTRNADTPVRAVPAVGADKSVRVTESQSLRCALIEPHGGGDSPVGMNHAYPQDFVLRLAAAAGITWYRDWSVKWHDVEQEKGQFDFSGTDIQINRVLDAQGRVLLLLPYPSARWNTTAQSDDLQEIIGARPKDLDDFANYARRTVEHYRGRIHDYHILNEPLYTHYALPMRAGYKMDDYLQVLEAAHRAIKAADPKATVVGGIAAPADRDLVRQFVERGGLRFVDVCDLHQYAAPVPAEVHEASYRTLRELMEKHGGAKPIWITEWGCYADDDPACSSQAAGDATMNRCIWPGEREATEHIVKYAAVTFAQGVRKIFFHAGTTGAINTADAGGVFFEFGGAPRKMYAGAAALTRLLGDPDEFIRSEVRDGVRAYVYRTGQRAVGIAWRDDGKEGTVRLPSMITACDVMGNELPSRTVPLGASPVYLVTNPKHADAIIQAVTGH